MYCGEAGCSEASGNLSARSHLERLMHESVVKREDDPNDEVCCDKSKSFSSLRLCLA